MTQDGHVDLVPDRIDRQGSTAILDQLTTEFPPLRLTETLAALLGSGQMSTRASQQFILYQSATLTVAADTRASAGYCYLAAWTAAPPDRLTRTRQLNRTTRR